MQTPLCVCVCGGGGAPAHTQLAHVRRGDIDIVAGHKSRDKHVVVRGADAPEFWRRAAADR